MTDDSERAAIRESVLARATRGKVTELLRMLLAAQWTRERVEALARQCVDDAVREHIARRAGRAS